jgi:hypothetical protein
MAPNSLAQMPSPIASFISQRGYFSKSQLPTVATLKERLEKTPLSKMEITLEYLQKSDPCLSSANWGGRCRDAWVESRLLRLHNNRISALSAMISKRKREVETLTAKAKTIKKVRA